MAPAHNYPLRAAPTAPPAAGRQHTLLACWLAEAGLPNNHRTGAWFGATQTRSRGKTRLARKPRAAAGALRLQLCWAPRRAELVGVEVDRIKALLTARQRTLDALLARLECSIGEARRDANFVATQEALLQSKRCVFRSIIIRILGLRVQELLHKSVWRLNRG